MNISTLTSNQQVQSSFSQFKAAQVAEQSSEKVASDSAADKGNISDGFVKSAIGIVPDWFVKSAIGGGVGAVAGGLSFGLTGGDIAASTLVSGFGIGLGTAGLIAGPGFFAEGKEKDKAFTQAGVMGTCGFVVGACAGVAGSVGASLLSLTGMNSYVAGAVSGAVVGGVINHVAVDLLMNN